VAQGKKNKPVSGILFYSSSEIYGDPTPDAIPTPETYRGNVSCTGPRACYDESKRFSEALVTAYGRYRKVDTRLVRIFNTYGPRMHPNDGRVVSNFIVQALRGEPITIFGEGGQTRSFCYVDDLVGAITRFMHGDNDFPGPINLGNPNEVTIRELAETVIRLTNSTSRIVFKPLPSDDPERRRPDISVARQRLGWQPTTNLEDGLRKVIEYFKVRLLEPQAAP